MSVLFKRQKLALSLYMAPVLILFAGIVVIPVIWTFAMSFTEWNGLTKATYIGLDNFQKLFQKKDLDIALKNSLIYSIVTTTIVMILGIFLAFVLSTFRFKLGNIFRNIYFFPVLISVTVIAQLWLSIYNSEYGLLNQIVKVLGIDWQQMWLRQPIKGIIAVAVVESWKGLGYHMMIIYSSMKNVGTVYYEAALIDGANKWQQFRYITLPMTMPTIKVCFVMCFVTGFQAFDLVMQMTGGGPGNTNLTLPIILYEAMFRYGKFGYSSAIAMVIVTICVSIMLILNKLTERYDHIY